jgi:NAD(P)-dependent dehydrogenase (short-subunit alcohol dehydrogenase family)
VKLDRRTAIITGAASGIGASAARLFAQEGARLVLVDIDATGLTSLTEELELKSTIVLDIAGDVSVPAICKSVIDRTAAQFGRLDVLFNNAGILIEGNLVDCTEEEWQRTIDVNLKSMYLLCRAAVPVMQRQGAGSIINMSSVAGPTGVAECGAYSVSKAGVLGLTKSLAMDFLHEGIRVNCICPAPVDTPSLQRKIACSSDPALSRRTLASGIPMKRFGTPEEIAAMALFLASDDSRFMTGQSIFMDGGMKL